MDLAAEFNAARDRVEAKHLKWLKGQGVGQLGMFFDVGGFAFGVEAIEIQTDGSYAPMPGGREAVVLYDDNEDGVDDLFAFLPKHPGKIYRRTNALRYLGCEHFWHARELQEPLYLRASAIDWLRQGRTGMVIVDWSDPHALQVDMRGLVEIRADTEALGKKIELALTRPFACPPILVANG